MNKKRIRQMNTALLRRLGSRPAAEYLAGQEKFLRALEGENYIQRFAPLYDGAVPRYKLVDGKVVERTAEEIEADKAKLPKPVIPKTNAELEQENKLLKAQLNAATERSDFIEDCIAEMAVQVYNDEV